MTVNKITSYQQFQEVIASDRPVVIDFYATWCGPCKIISPVFHRFASQIDFSDYVDFYEVDVDEQPEISAAAGIRAMPTFIAFASSQPIGTLMGANPRGLLNLVTNAARSSAAAQTQAPNPEKQSLAA